MQAMRTRTLPKTTSITPTQSMTLVKNMFRASFSSIAYIRDLFGDDVGLTDILAKQTLKSVAIESPAVDCA
jgi:HORMA domain